MGNKEGNMCLHLALWENEQNEGSGEPKLTIPNRNLTYHGPSHEWGPPHPESEARSTTARVRSEIHLIPSQKRLTHCPSLRHRDLQFLERKTLECLLIQSFHNTNNPCGNDYFVLKRDRPDGGPSPSKECRKDSNVACLCGLFTLHENDSIFKCSLIKLPVN